MKKFAKLRRRALQFILFISILLLVQLGTWISEEFSLPGGQSSSQSESLIPSPNPSQSQNQGEIPSKTPSQTPSETPSKTPNENPGPITSPMPVSAGEEMSVHFINVGQGDSIYIDIPMGPKVLVDGGDWDHGEKVVSYLRELGVGKIDYLIATHPHADHIGGLPDIIKAFELGQIFMPKVSHTTQTFENLLLAIRDKGLKIQTAKGGVILREGKDWKIEFLAPLRDYGEDLNNWSAVIKVTYKGQVILLMGDAEEEVELEIIKGYKDLKAQILKVGHHGSRTSTTDRFLDKVKPNYAVISSGRSNDYGHPHKVTLKKLEKRGIKILRTDTRGNIVFQINRDEIILKD